MPEELNPVENLVAIGIGGSGAKCVEALVHLAASGSAPANIFPILIDQDADNGNVERCKNVISSYANLRNSIDNRQQWFFKSEIEYQKRLLPLTPQDARSNYRAAIGATILKDNLASNIVDTLYLNNQLEESLDYGYKKRAHMGSILFRQMLEREKTKKADEKGLQYIIEKIKAFDQPHIVIFGSLFGGSGASGMVEVGKYFRKELTGAILKVVFLTPSFVIGAPPMSGDKDANLVKSDADMQAVKIALEIYKDEIEKSFHHVYVLGSEVSRLQGEFPTPEGVFGGKTQKNPSHVFEMLAASVSTLPALQQERTRYHSFVVETTASNPPVGFTLAAVRPATKNSATLKLDINLRNISVVRDFAAMLNDLDAIKTKTDWWKRQPWYHPKHRDEILSWGKRHHSWWMEMSSENWSSEEGMPEHRWKVFSLEWSQQISTFQFSAYLSRYIGNRNTSNLSSLFHTIDELPTNNLEELKWASI